MMSKPVNASGGVLVDGGVELGPASTLVPGVLACAPDPPIESDGVALFTHAVFTRRAPALAVTSAVSVIVLGSSTSRLALVHSISFVPVAIPQCHPGPVALSGTSPLGMGSVTTTWIAGEGPMSVTTTE